MAEYPDASAVIYRELQMSGNLVYGVYNMSNYSAADLPTRIQEQCHDVSTVGESAGHGWVVVFFFLGATDRARCSSDRTTL